jgi:hypothetical protein
LLRTNKPYRQLPSQQHEGDAKINTSSAAIKDTLAHKTTTSPSTSATRSLLCHEMLPAQSSRKSPALMPPTPYRFLPGSVEYRAAVISAARDVAIFREAARIIRRKARELCSRRISASAEPGTVGHAAAGSQPPPASKMM